MADRTSSDPLHAALYKAAVGGADAYRSVRQVLRRDRGVLRVGNRFVPENRYRQVGFIALGRAAPSMALAALDALGDRLTQGFLASSEAPPPYLPFRSVVVTDDWAPDPAAPSVLAASREIAGTLGPEDLLLVLVSPGASRAVLEPPPSMSREEFGHHLKAAHTAGANAEELGALVRVAGAGGVGGRLLPADVRCEVQPLLVERGEGPALAGGGPTVPVRPAELASARNLLARLELDRAIPLPEPTAANRPRRLVRAVSVAGPNDALRATTDLAFEKGWVSRFGDLLLRTRPEEASDRFLARIEELLPDARRSGSRAKGVVVASMATLDAPDGVGEGEAAARFLDVTFDRLRRREMSVGLYRTVGAPGTPESGAGASVGRFDRGGLSTGAPRRIEMKAGITDVGCVIVGVLPWDASKPT